MKGGRRPGFTDILSRREDWFCRTLAIERCKRRREKIAGNRYTEIIDLYSEHVYNLAVRMLGNKQDAEEATQDVFVRVFKSIERFRGDSSLSTWIWRIASNVCISRLKKRKIDTVSFDESAVDPAVGQESSCSKQEHRLYHHELSDIIERCISMLPPNESAAITLLYIEELSYEEIADILKLPMGTLSTILHRGRKRLGELLKDRKEEL